MSIKLFACVECGALYHEDYIKWEKEWSDFEQKFVNTDFADCTACKEPEGVSRFAEITIPE